MPSHNPLNPTAPTNPLNPTNPANPTNPLDPYTCREAFSRLDDYLDRELTEGEIERVEQHLHVCATCAREFRFEATVLGEVRGKIQRIAVPAGLQARVWDRLRRSRSAG